MTHVRITWRLYGCPMESVQCVNCAGTLHPDGTTGRRVVVGMRWEPTEADHCDVQGSECLHLETFDGPPLPQPQIKGWV